MNIRVKNAAINTLILFGALLIGTVLIEIVLSRIFYLGSPVLYRADPRYGYSPVPNQKVSRFRGSSVTIDSLGLRTNEDWSHEADFKILFVGDSVTYGGSYIDDSELFSERVCTQLNDESVHHFNCGNAGVNAWGIDNMTGFLSAKDFNDESVIVVIIVTGDAERGMSKLSGHPFWSSKPPEPFPATLELGMFFLDQFRLQVRYPNQNRIPKLTEDLKRYIGKLIQELFLALKQKQKEGKAILLIHWPRKEVVQSGYRENDQLLINLLKKTSFPLIEFKPLILTDLEEVFYDAVHLDRKGHKFFADIVSQNIRKLLKKSRLQGSDASMSLEVLKDR
jgi:hypothetical protein